MVMHVVVAEFPIKEGMMGEFCDFMKGPFGFDVTCGSKGCRTIKCYTKDNSMGLYEEWLTEEDHKAYLEMRSQPGHAGFEKGFGGIVEKFFAGPPSIKHFELDESL
ncbi:hypothetical protein T484DRAFT_1853378 [Baffinella frigidus]|nr:hypothetical protein T484DRAFT_1853378 [Cryptophyta sp. CCMP2293]